MKQWIHIALITITLTSSVYGQGTFINPVPRSDCRGTGEMLTSDECAFKFAETARVAAGHQTIGKAWNMISAEYKAKGFKFTKAKNTITSIAGGVIINGDNDHDTQIVDGIGEVSADKPVNFKLTETYSKKSSVQMGVVLEYVEIIATGTIEITNGGYQITVSNMNVEKKPAVIIPRPRMPRFPTSRIPE